MAGDAEEPPDGITLTLDEALRLLGALEDASATLNETGHLVALIDLDPQIRLLHRRLGFDIGGDDGE